MPEKADYAAIMLARQARIMPDYAEIPDMADYARLCRINFALKPPMFETVGRIFHFLSEHPKNFGFFAGHFFFF